jgi:hypothetical protein
MLLAAVVSHKATAESKQIATEDNTADLLAADLTRGEVFEVLKAPDGRVSMVIGRFDVGLDAETSRQDDRALEALSGFVGAHEAYQRITPRWRVASSQPIDGEFYILHLDQYVDDVRVVDADQTAVFFRDGALQSLNGRLVSPSSPGPRDIGVDRAIEIFRSERVVGTDLRLVFDGRAWVDGEYTLEEVYSDLLGGFAWQYRHRGQEALLDQQTASVVSVDNGEEQLLGLCNVAHRDWPRDGSGYATLLNESSNNVMQTAQCEASESLLGNTCTFRLQLEPFGSSHQIERVEDVDGAEAEVVQSCATTTAQFPGTNGDAVREQGAFLVQEQMRYYTTQNCWLNTAPDTEYDVQIHVDDAALTVAPAAFNQYYSVNGAEIHCNPAQPILDSNNVIVGYRNGCTQDVISHEYGHYVVSTYGDFSNLCSVGVDEGDSLDEAIANAFASLTWRDGYLTKARYGAFQGFAFNNGSVHTTSASTRPVACLTGNDPRDGIPFLQAFWELSYNRNCSTAACTANSLFNTSAVSSIWSGLNEDDVLWRLGRALAHSISVNPTNGTTFAMVRAQIRARIVTDTNLATANRAQAVFSHHGLTCPGCCPGC